MKAWKQGIFGLLGILAILFAFIACDNDISYQHFLSLRKTLLTHYGNRFVFQKEKIEKAINMIDCLMEIPANVDYEELINSRPASCPLLFSASGERP